MIITSGVVLRSIYASGQHTDTAGGGCRSSFPSSFRGSADGYKHKGLLLSGCDPVQRVRFASLNIANNVKSLAGWAFSQSKKCQGWTIFLMQGGQFSLCKIGLFSSILTRFQKRKAGDRAQSAAVLAYTGDLCACQTVVGCWGGLGRAKLGRLLRPFMGLYVAGCVDASEE